MAYLKPIKNCFTLSALVFTSISFAQQVAPVNNQSVPTEPVITTAKVIKRGDPVDNILKNGVSTNSADVSASAPAGREVNKVETRMPINATIVDVEDKNLTDKAKDIYRYPARQISSMEQAASAGIVVEVPDQPVLKGVESKTPDALKDLSFLERNQGSIFIAGLFLVIGIAANFFIGRKNNNE